MAQEHETTRRLGYLRCGVGGRPAAVQTRSGAGGIPDAVGETGRFATDSSCHEASAEAPANRARSRAADRPVALRAGHLVALALAAASVGAASGQAPVFEGWQFETSLAEFGGATFSVIDVFAKFDSTTANVLNVFNGNIVNAGGEPFRHSDFNTLSNLAGGWSVGVSFDTVSISSSVDSFVLVGGPIGAANTTSLDGGFSPNTGPTIANNAGWFNLNPIGPQGRVDPKTLRIQVARLVIAAADLPATLRWRANIGFNAGPGTSAQFGYGGGSGSGPLFEVPYAGGATCPAPQLGVDFQRLAAGGGASAVSIDASCVWEAISNEDWVVVDPGSASGSGGGEVQFSLSENISTAIRVAEIAVTTSGGSATIQIEQTGRGEVEGWGLPKYGLNAPPSGLPAPMIQVSANRRNNAGVLADGTVAVWGLDTDGQSNPPPELLDPSTAALVQVSMGQRHVVALRSDGTVFAWGRNADGQCNVPPGLQSISIAAGRAHSLAVRADGTVAAWGRNQVGQCDVPAGLAGAIAVAAGDWHSVALRSNGSVVAWGDDSFGQSTVPEGLTGVSAIAAGRNHTLALRSDGTVVAWGDDRSGQSTVRADLADPATANVVVISGGRTFSVVLRGDGTIVYMGTPPNGAGTPPAGLNDAFTIAAGDDATLVLTPPVIAPPPMAGGATIGGGQQAATILVPEHFRTIGEAVAVAGSGSVILVGPGVYPERLDLGDRGLTIAATGRRGEVLIDANGQRGSTVTIGSPEGVPSGLITRVVGFTIAGGDAESGGGVLVQRAIAEILDCVVHSNRAATGGGIAVRHADLSLVSSDVTGNAAAIGGGLLAVASSVWIDSSSLNSNRADLAGGGVWADDESIVAGGMYSLCDNLPEQAVYEGEAPSVDPQACPMLGDLDGDGAIGASDVAALLAAWGECVGCPADLDGDGRVDARDLSILLAEWAIAMGGGR